MARPRALKTSTPVSTKSHKRQLSNGTPATVTSSSRASKRIKTSTENTPKSTTPKKSKYFDGSDSDEDDEDQIESQGPEESGYEDEDASATDLTLPSPSQRARTTIIQKRTIRGRNDEENHPVKQVRTERRLYQTRIYGGKVSGLALVLASRFSLRNQSQKAMEVSSMCQTRYILIQCRS